MVTPRNKRRLTELNKEKCEEHLRSNLAQNSNDLRSQEDYITQVSEEIERRASEKLSQDFRTTENRILGALACLDDFLIQGHSGTAPETSRNAFSTSQGTNEDDSQSDPHPEAGIIYNQTTRNSGPDKGHDANFLQPFFVFFICTELRTPAIQISAPLRSKNKKRTPNWSNYCRRRSAKPVGNCRKLKRITPDRQRTNEN